MPKEGLVFKKKESFFDFFVSINLKYLKNLINKRISLMILLLYIYKASVLVDTIIFDYT